MPLTPDTRMLGAYKGYESFSHERVTILHVARSHYVIMSPDGDIYMEDMDPVNWHPLVNLRSGPGMTKMIPVGIDPAHCLMSEDGEAAIPTPMPPEMMEIALAEAEARQRLTTDGRGWCEGVVVVT